MSPTSYRTAPPRDNLRAEPTKCITGCYFLCKTPADPSLKACLRKPGAPAFRGAARVKFFACSKEMCGGTGGNIRIDDGLEQRRAPGRKHLIPGRAHIFGPVNPHPNKPSDSAKPA
jgi:hypothetical protein